MNYLWSGVIIFLLLRWGATMGKTSNFKVKTPKFKVKTPKFKVKRDTATQKKLEVEAETQ